MASTQPSQVHTPQDDRSLGALISDLAQDTTTLVQQEVALAKAEMSEKASQVGRGISTLAIGGVVLLAGLLALLDFAIYGLAELLPEDLSPWLGALIVGVIVAVIGFIMLQSGRKKIQSTTLTPNRTATSLQQDKEMVKEHVS
jgi:drug/metabolite transporter (DMT)-like permease